MEPNYLRLQALRNTIFLNPSPMSATTNLVRISFSHHHPSHRISSTNSSSSSTSNDDIPPPQPPLITPSETVEIRFRRGSRRRRKAREEALLANQQQAKPKEAPKKWEEMSVAEKALELYVGEKGLLFWLNKFAYASIFIIIGAWILFRFVGPALNLYQLDAPPLPPSSILKS